MKRVLLLIAAACSLAANGQTRQQMYDTIPFDIVQNKFIFTAQIDGKPVRLILDTGGQNIIVSDSVEKFGVEFVRDQTIADVNDARIRTYVGKVKNFKVGRFWGWQVKEVTVVPNNPFFRELGVAGAVGGDMFKEACLTVDRREKRFMISYPYRPPGISRTAGVAMNTGGTYHAVVPVEMGGRTVDVLFDTGASGFLSLSTSDYERIKDGVESQESGHGILYVGAAGIAGAVTDTIRKVNIPQMTLPGGKVLTNVGTLAGNHPSTIAGQQLFDLGRVMLDYPRGLLYFFPYEEGVTDVSAQTRVWNVRILPMVEDGHGLFRVVATIGDAGVEVGERVWAIDGTVLADQKLSESVVNELLDGCYSATLTVGDDRREVVVRKI